MNPDLEFFLESAFENIQQSLPHVGRVVVEPDYETSYADDDQQKLAEQLKELLKSQTVGATALSSVDGQAIDIPTKLEPLSKYIRSITLHAEPVEGPWIEVAPPGNWI